MYALWILFGAFVIDIVVRLRKALNELNGNVKMLDTIEQDDESEERIDENDPEEIRLKQLLKNAYNGIDDEEIWNDPEEIRLKQLLKNAYNGIDDEEIWNDPEEIRLKQLLKNAYNGDD